MTLNQYEDALMIDGIFKLQNLNMKSSIVLPSLASYKPQCQHGSGRWLAYQAGLNEVMLIEVNPEGTIRDSVTININGQPLKSLKLAYSEWDRVPYLGLALLSKYIVFKRDKSICTERLQLNCNIADFPAGLVAVEAVNDGIQIYFVFVTAKGVFITVPVNNPEKKVVFEIETANISGMCVKDSFAYAGTEMGLVLKVDMNTRKIVDKYETGSKFPIFNLKIVQNYLILGTCQGEIHITSLDFTDKKIISAHEGMISLFSVDKDKLYSIGDDLVMRRWVVSKEGTLSQEHSQFFTQKPNMLFHLHDRTYINFYQETEAFEV